MTTAGVVGSERPGLKPRAQSASPLKGAGGRPGARVDRLGGGAVWISRLQPAWGLSPAVHGRAIVDTGARLIGAACRARRVGHLESPRLVARRARRRLAPTNAAWCIPGRAHGHHGWRQPPPCRGQAVPDPPARQGRQGDGGAIVTMPAGSLDRAMHATDVAAPCGAGGRGGASPLQRGQPTPRRRQRHHRDARPPSCRGQAVPDPPAWKGRQSPGRVMGAVSGGSPMPRIPGAGVGRAGGAGGRGSASPLQG
jgi:hypothetical protein